VKAVRDMTQAELAARVATVLRGSGIEVVLSGGACVAIYSSGQYVSMDLDLINIQLAKAGLISHAMGQLGFNREGRHYHHPESEFIVEFPPGPLAVGEEPVKRIDEAKYSTGTLRLLSPTDCVKDRLTWYYHSQDLQCLAQAILVAQSHDIDLAEVKRWSGVEGKMKAFERIQNQLRTRKRKGA